MSEKNDNKKIIKITVAAIIIIMIGTLTYLYIINQKRTTKEPEEPKTIYTTYSHKGFNYNIPADIKFSKVNDKRFEFETTSAKFIIEPYIDSQQEMYNHSELYYNQLIAHGINVSKPNIKEINGYPVLVFEKTDTQEILCYFGIDKTFAYEVEITNNDKTYNVDELAKIIDILKNAEYDKTKIKNYQFDIIDFSGLIEK